MKLVKKGNVMTEGLDQERLDRQKILAFGENRLVGISKNGYFAPSLAGILTVKPTAVLQSSQNSDEESAWVTHEEASYAAQSYNLEGIDIVQSIIAFRTTATKAALGFSDIDLPSPIC